MYKICKNEQSANRQNYIADCMIQLWKHHCYHQISVSDICKHASIPRKTFYRYFENKEDVFLFISESLLMQYENYSGPYQAGERYTMQKDFEKFFMFNKMKADLWELVRRDNMTQRVVEWIVSKIIENERVKLLFHQPQDEMINHMKICFFMHGLFALFFDWQKQGYPTSPKEIAQLAARLINMPLYEW